MFRICPLSAVPLRRTTMVSCCLYTCTQALDVWCVLKDVSELADQQHRSCCFHCRGEFHLDLTIAGVPMRDRLVSNPKRWRARQPSLNKLPSPRDEQSIRHLERHDTQALLLFGICSRKYDKLSFCICSSNSSVRHVAAEECRGRKKLAVSGIGTTHRVPGVKHLLLERWDRECAALLEAAET